MKMYKSGLPNCQIQVAQDGIWFHVADRFGNRAAVQVYSIGTIARDALDNWAEEVQTCKETDAELGRMIRLAQEEGLCATFDGHICDVVSVVDKIRAQMPNM